ncbi:MAG TPA: AMP-binding protein, partial [Chitinophagaceae bacterium]|nr:AMP-binding protein [Chitinophagaceae bacterium]
MATPIPTRIFDLLSRQRSLFPQKACLLVEEEGAWRSYSTDEVMTLVRQLAAGLLRAGLSYGDGTAEGRSKVAIISRNRPEWIITDLAVQRAGGVVVPVYPTLHEDELLYILEHASVQYVFTDEADLFRLIRDRRGVLPQLKDIFSFLPLPGARSWKELLVEAGAGEAALLEESNQRITGTDLATIVYTSGTTGTPKGVMLSHSNILHNIMSCYQLLPAVLKPGSPVLSFLPLSHAFERAANYLYLYAGQQIHFTGMATIGQDIKRVAPVMFTTVPRLLEKVYEAIQLKGGKLTGWKKKLFDLSIRLAEAYDPHASPSLTVKLQLALVDRLVYRQWRAALGGQVKAIITGAAPCPVKLLRVFSAAGIVIMEGYGMTEASPVVAANRYEPGGRRFGTV